MICRAMKTTPVIAKSVHDAILIASVLSTSCTDTGRVAEDVMGMIVCRKKSTPNVQSDPTRNNENNSEDTKENLESRTPKHRKHDEGS